MKTKTKNVIINVAVVLAACSGLIYGGYQFSKNTDWDDLNERIIKGALAAIFTAGSLSVPEEQLRRGNGSPEQKRDSLLPINPMDPFSLNPTGTIPGSPG